MTRADAGFRISPRLVNAVGAGPYVRSHDDPLYRPLRVYTLDPTTSRLDGRVATINVPYEPEPLGPGGHLFEMDLRDGTTGATYTRLDLNSPSTLIGAGRAPSPSDHLFHQQMVYAVSSSVYDAFRRALGRDPAWSFSDAEAGVRRLRFRPYGYGERNAYYDGARGEIVFGMFQADERVTGRNVPRGTVYTCLSHDVIAHEVTHALLGGLRAHFTHPSSPDVLAFHEAFADLVAIFLHFEHSVLVERTIRASRGKLRTAGVLQELAAQFGATTGSGRALRSALREQEEGPPQHTSASFEAHERGSVLVSAVLEAFFTVYERKAARYVRLATGRSTLPTEGEPDEDLVVILAQVSAKLARQFLDICIRAIDYCPPVDIEFGEFLRAVITADQDLVPDDPWGYREAWIDAFALHGIYPNGVPNLDEEELRWERPAAPPPRIEELAFARLEFDGDPGRPAGRAALLRQAQALGEAMTVGPYGTCAGIAPSGRVAGSADSIDPPAVESIRTLRRVGPDGQVVFDLVAEVTQRRVVRDGGPAFEAFGGSTLMFDAHGRLRLAIYKRVVRDAWIASQRAFITSEQGRKFWVRQEDAYEPERQVFKLLHEP